MALISSRNSRVRGCPSFAGGGINGSSSCHSASDRSVSYGSRSFIQVVYQMTASMSCFQTASNITASVGINVPDWCRGESHTPCRPLSKPIVTTLCCPASKTVILTVPRSTVKLQANRVGTQHCVTLLPSPSPPGGGGEKGYLLRSCGNSMTSRILVCPVKIIARRSRPIPIPPVGGIP